MERKNSLKLPICPSCDLYIQFGTKIVKCNECKAIMHFRCCTTLMMCGCGSSDVDIMGMKPNFHQFRIILEHFTEIMNANIVSEGILEESCNKIGISTSHVQGFRNTYCSLKQNDELVNSELYNQIKKMSHTLLTLCRVIMFCIFTFFVAGLIVSTRLPYDGIILISISLLSALFFYYNLPVLDPYALLETAQRGPNDCFPCYRIKILENERDNIIDEAWEEFCLVEHHNEGESFAENKPV